MKRNLNRGMAISKWLSRALYCDLSEMTGLCVEEYVHLPQNERDLDAMAMRVLAALGEAGEWFEIVLVVSWCGNFSCCAGFVFSLTFTFKGSVGVRRELLQVLLSTSIGAGNRLWVMGGFAYSDRVCVSAFPVRVRLTLSHTKRALCTKRLTKVDCFLRNRS